MAHTTIGGTGLSNQKVQLGWCVVPEGKATIAVPKGPRTSPIYVMIGGRGVYNSEAAAEIAAEMEQSIKEITKNGIFASDNERRGILQLYRSAINQMTSVGEEP